MSMESWLKFAKKTKTTEVVLQTRLPFRPTGIPSDSIRWRRLASCPSCCPDPSWSCSLPTGFSAAPGPPPRAPGPPSSRWPPSPPPPSAAAEGPPGDPGCAGAGSSEIQRLSEPAEAWRKTKGPLHEVEVGLLLLLLLLLLLVVVVVLLLLA